MKGADVICSIILLLFLGRTAIGFQERTYSSSSLRRKFQNRLPSPSWKSSLVDSPFYERAVISLSASLLEDSESSVGEFNADEPSSSSSSPEQGYLDRFGGTGRLYSGAQVPSETVLERMRRATVVIVGIGGVGSWAAEAICRSGVGSLVLVDLDDICISNTNRQIHATTSGIGLMKIDVMKQRLLDIHPDCNVTLVHDFVDEENARDMLETIGPITALIDAIDGATAKSALIGACADLSIPVVTVGGVAGRRDPFQIICADLVNVEDDRLLSNCRKILRKKYNFPAGLSFSQKRATKKKLKKWKITCVYTRGALPPKHTSNQDENASSSFRLCDGSLGTACFVTGAYGFAAASLCIDMIANDKLIPPNRR